MTTTNHDEYNPLLKIKLEWGFWFIDWVYINDIDAVISWEKAYRDHPLYWDVVEELGRKPDFVEDLLDIYYNDDFVERHPFKFIFFWIKIVFRISGIFQWLAYKCDRMSARLLKCNVYELPWYC